MKRTIILSILTFGFALGLGFGNAGAQIFDPTQSFTLNGNSGDNLSFAQYTGNISDLLGVEITLNVSSVTLNAGIQGTNGGIPSATFTDTISVADSTPAPPNLIETDNFTAPSTLAQNVNQTYLVDNFALLPNSSNSEVVTNLVNYVGGSTFNEDVMTSLMDSNVENGNVQQFQGPGDYTVNGTMQIEFLVAAPEPHSWGLALIAGAAFATLIARRRSPNVA